MDSEFLIMEKLEKLYKKEKTITLQQWMNSLNQLKAKKITEISGTFNKIMEINQDMTKIVMNNYHYSFPKRNLNLKN